MPSIAAAARARTSASSSAVIGANAAAAANAASCSCVGGTTTCDAQGTAWGPCVGEVTPQPEICATPADEDCDGAPGQCGTFSWGQRFGDVVNNQDVVDVVADAQGNIYLAGNFEGTIDLGGGPLVSTGAGATDVFIAKLSPAGAHLWSKRFGSADYDDEVRRLSLDPAGDLLLTGGFASTIDFGGGTMTTGGPSPFVAKLDPNGNHIWSKTFSGSGDNWGTGIAADPQGNVLVTGDFTGFVNCGGPVLSGAGSNDIFVAKLTAAGNHVWSQRHGGSAAERTRSIDVDSTGAAVIIGYFNGSVNVGGGLFTAVGSGDVLLFKLSAAGAHVWNAAGAHLWSQRWSSPGAQLGFGLSVDGSGNVALTGRMEGAPDFGGGALASAGARDVFLAKLGP
ncbi:MAG: hypothetical protein IT372_31520 [Polyangiaceae bacterium]|nr:hypothetical protein [Polyangiaceae bacterium]